MTAPAPSFDAVVICASSEVIDSFDMPQDTPLANLWHVGDAVKDYGDGGTRACADTGRIAAERATAWLARP